MEMVDCPHCGSDKNNADFMFEGVDDLEETVLAECGCCEKEFYVDRFVSFWYDTRKPCINYRVGENVGSFYGFDTIREILGGDTTADTTSLFIRAWYDKYGTEHTNFATQKEFEEAWESVRSSI